VRIGANGQQPHSRHKAYHTIRYGYYNALGMLGGLSQLLLLLLGVYLWCRFGFGPYEDPVHVATYTIHFPIIAVLVGTCQTGMGIYGLGRATGYFRMGGPSDHSFLYVICGVWIWSTFLQFVFQPAYSDGDVYNAEASTVVACVYLGFFLMPAFLDYLVRTTPVQPRPEYYGLAKDAYYKEDLPTIWLGMAPQKDCNNGIYLQRGWGVRPKTAWKQKGQQARRVL
jgi:hypothetical protein